MWRKISVCAVIAFGALFSGCRENIPADVVPKQATVLVRMTQWQEPWFAKQLENWPRANELAIEVESYQALEELPTLLETRDKSRKGHPFLFAKVEGRMLETVIRKELIFPLEELLPAGESAFWQTEYDQRAVAMAQAEGKTWALPRKIENHILALRADHVHQAALYWTSMRAELDELFRRENGRGLPNDYTLEADPASWDMYDLAVAGYYWSRTPIQGRQGPRLGHRTRDYPGTFVDIAARFFALGGTVEQLVAVRGQALVDFLTWEAFLLRYGLYHPSMVEPGWSGADLYRRFGEYDLLAVTVHQVDAFQFHRQYGPQQDEQAGRLAFAPMIRGVSLELDAGGQPARVGTRRSHLAGWWWAIPKSCPCPRLALQAMRYVLSATFQSEECRRFGNYPVRRDLLAEPAKAFPEKWMQRIIAVSTEQFATDCIPVPDERVRYQQAWRNLYTLWHQVANHPKLHDQTVPLRTLDIETMVAQAGQG